MNASDRRAKITTEVFTNIRFVKMNALENYFLSKLVEVKEEELFWIKKNYIRALVSITANNTAPELFIASLFSSILLMGHDLTLEGAFAILSIFGILYS